jgi:tetratricopeptide (TPR) repeat protein
MRITGRPCQPSGAQVPICCYPRSVRPWALCLVLAIAAPTLAQPLPQREGSWRELVIPERRAGQFYLRHGLAKLLRASAHNDPATGDPPPWALLDQALVRLERAGRLMPGHPEVLYLTAVALSRWERQGSDGANERRSEEALEAWREVRRADPSYQPDRVAFELAMLYTLQQDYAHARAEYSIALAHQSPEPVFPGYLPLQMEEQLMLLYLPISLHTLEGNLAEVSMLDGDLSAAIQHYTAALDASRDQPVGQSLARWGLALALDRRGDTEESLRVATRVLREDPIPPDHPIYGEIRARHGLFAVLHLPGVFFEPPCEIHAYEGIGHEALARGASSAEQAEEERSEALTSWRRFFAEGGNESRFAEIARGHLTRLEHTSARPQTPRSRHTPSPFRE